MKYKVGDIVRVKTWDELIEDGCIPDYDGDLQVGRGYFTQAMKPCGGRIFRVAETDTMDGLFRLVDSDGEENQFAFFDEILDLAPFSVGKDKPTDAAIEVPQTKEYSKATERVENNAVDHPNHYTAGGIECIESIRASLGNKEFADYCKGNIMKYLWRYRLKNGVEDLKKAKVYLDWMIEAEEA